MEAPRPRRAEQVVHGHARAVEGAHQDRQTVEREQELLEPDEVRGEAQEARTLGQRFADDPHLELFEIPQPAVDQARGSGRRPHGDVVALDEGRAKAAAGGVEQGAGAHDPAADDRQGPRARSRDARGPGRAGRAAARTGRSGWLARAPRSGHECLTPAGRAGCARARTPCPGPGRRSAAGCGTPPPGRRVGRTAVRAAAASTTTTTDGGDDEHVADAGLAGISHGRPGRGHQPRSTSAGTPIGATSDAARERTAPLRLQPGLRPMEGDREIGADDRVRRVTRREIDRGRRVHGKHRNPGVPGTADHLDGGPHGLSRADPWTPVPSRASTMTAARSMPCARIAMSRATGAWSSRDAGQPVEPLPVPGRIRRAGPLVRGDKDGDHRSSPIRPAGGRRRSRRPRCCRARPGPGPADPARVVTATARAAAATAVPACSISTSPGTPCACAFRSVPVIASAVIGSLRPHRPAHAQLVERACGQVRVVGGQGGVPVGIGYRVPAHRRHATEPIRPRSRGSWQVDAALLRSRPRSGRSSALAGHSRSANRHRHPLHVVDAHPLVVPRLVERLDATGRIGCPARELVLTRRCIPLEPSSRATRSRRATGWRDASDHAPSTPTSTRDDGCGAGPGPSRQPHRARHPRTGGG